MCIFSTLTSNMLCKSLIKIYSLTNIYKFVITFKYIYPMNH